MKTQLDTKLQTLLTEMYPKLAEKCNARAKNFNLGPTAHLELFVAQFKLDAGIKPANGVRDFALLEQVQSKYWEKKKKGLLDIQKNSPDPNRPQES